MKENFMTKEEMNLKNKQTQYRTYGLPAHYAGLTYDDAAGSNALLDRIHRIVENAPMRGSVLVNDFAAPIIDQFIKQKRRVRGIDFAKLMENPFNRDGEHFKPQADVVVLYNIGLEASVNSTVPSQLIKGIINYYKKYNTLLILEAPYSPMQFQEKYDHRPLNSIKLQESTEEVWT